LFFINLFLFILKNGKKEIIYKEQYNGMWWKTTQNTLQPAKILSIILYSDATNCDKLSKTQLYPIYMSLGNIPTWRRNKQDAKQLLGYFPIIKKNDKNKLIDRQTFYKCLEIILDPIQRLKNSGINLLINNKMVWFIPKVSTIIADWPEAATFCLTYKSAQSNRPCHFCLIEREKLAQTDCSKHNLVLRNHENMQNYLNNGEENSVCIESISNFFWNFK
jgi:hypothetical protein